MGRRIAIRDRRITRYDFTPAENKRALDVGNARQDYHEQRGTPNAHKLPQNPEHDRYINYLGALTELCTATYLDRLDEWNDRLGDFGPDIGDDIEVKSTDWPNGRLIVYDSYNDDHRAVLTRTNHVRHGIVWLVGWFPIGQAKNPDYVDPTWRDPCYAVDPIDLYPMDQLRKANP